MDNAEVIVLRLELQWFAEKMEQVLRKNDWKNGWKDMEGEEALERLEEELDELKAAMSSVRPNKIVEEATDVANFAMFIAYNEAKTN
ncbi:MAG: hypothetical protein AABY07_02490 [Nanoarchaeota archaeon]